MKCLIAVLALLGLAASPALAQDADPLPTRVETYKTVDGHGLEARLFLPKAARGKAPLLLLLHGGGWTAGEADWTDGAAQRFADRGIVALSIAYRLSGDASTPADAFADTCDAFAWARSNARRLGADPARIGGYGVSAGGHLVGLAGSLGCKDGRGRVWRPALMILRSPPLDVSHDVWFGKLMHGAPAEPLSPLAAAGAATSPTFIVQGDADTLTPLKLNRAFCDKMAAAGGACEMDVYPGVGHLLTRDLANQEQNFDVDPATARSAWDHTVGFLRRRGWVN